MASVHFLKGKDGAAASPAIGGSLRWEGHRTAAFCSFQDAIAVGSRDGMLDLWTKLSGLPLEPTRKTRDTGSRSKQRAKTEPVCAARVTDRALPRPMMNVRPDGPRNDEEGHGGERRSLQNSKLVCPERFAFSFTHCVNGAVTW